MNNQKSTTGTPDQSLETIPNGSGRQMAIIPITPRSIFQMSEVQVRSLKTLADMIAASQLDYIKVDNRTPRPSEVFLLFLTGLEIGFEPMTSLAFFDVIQGKVALKPVGMMAKINASKLLENFILVADETKAVCTMKRVGMEPHTETFTIEDATRLNLLTKRGSGYISQPKTMLKWRAISACARVLFSDVIAGLFMSTDLDSEVIADEQGNIVHYPEPQPASEGQPAGNNPPPPPEATPTGEPTSAGQQPEQQNPPPPPNPVAIVWDEAKQKWLLDLLTKLGFVKDNYPWILEHLEPGKVLKGFGETTLGLATLENRLRELAAERNQPAQPKTQPSPNVSNLGAGMANPLTVDQVRYYVSGDKKTAYLEFVAPTPIRAYGRSSTFKKLVGDTYYHANGFEAMKPNTPEPYAVEALQITWAVKGEGQHKYLIAEKCEPLLVEEPEIPPPLPNGDQDLDAWFNNDPLPPEEDPFRFDTPVLEPAK